MRTIPIIPPRSRRGSMFAEAIMALAITLAVLGGVAQVAATVARHRRVSEIRSLAVFETGNQMEALMARSWDELTTENLRNMELSAVVRERLPGARLRIEVLQEMGDRMRSMRIEIDWLVDASRRGEPVRLVAWRSKSL